jgi:uncharacterized RDD family membrane protein YckC
MRCPKCHYISYDSTGRCRNCGYEFSLVADSPGIELPIQTGEEPIGPLGDLPLTAASVVSEPTPAPDASQSVRARAARAVRAAAPRRSAQDLPLFKDRAPDMDAPLAPAPAAPRPPLSVRRAQPVPPRPVQAATTTPALELEVRELSRDSYAADGDEAGAQPAGAGRRLLAAMIDVTVLGSINLGVVYLTLQICGFSFIEVFLLPPAPLVTFLLLLDGGYLTAFTAACGQTLGKMAAGIKVVSLDDDGRVPPGSAVLRSLGYLVSVLPAGLGFLPALFGPDGRALHDRLADTRVIRA